MTELDGTLSDLARLESGSEPIVSLYLDIRWRDEHQRNRVRLFVQERVRQTLGHYLPGSPGRDGLERTLKRVQDHVSGLLGQQYESDKNGLALFACESLNLWRPFFFRRPLRNELATDRIPHLMQLARFQDDFAPAFVVMPSHEGADIYRVSLGDLAVEAKLRGAPLPLQKKEHYSAGTGKPGHHSDRDKKNQRHEQEFLQKTLRAAATELETLCDRTPACAVVLVGTSEMLAVFERELSERIRERIIARLPRPRGWEGGDGVRNDGIIEGVAKAVQEHEAKDEEHAVDSVVGQALRGGLGVLGPRDVIEALNQGRVHKLVIEADFDRNGWQCDNCNALGENTEALETCPYCDAHVHGVHVLGEALIARALRGDAEVEVVAHTNKLHSYRGVGAFLRQTTATGLRGSSQRWPTAAGPNQP